METDWVIQEPIDFEYKKYRLLAYFKRIDELLQENKLYPTFIELSLHLANLQTISKENVLLFTDKIFKSFDDEVLLKDLKAKQLPNLSTTEIVEMNNILKFSTSKFYEYFSIVKSYWSLIYDTITLSIKRNKKYLKRGVGYMTYHSKKTNSIYVWEYNLKKVDSNFDEHNADVKLIYTGNKKDKTFNNIIEEYSQFNSKEQKYSPVFEMKITQEYPIEETLLPLFKRKLLSYILQSLKFDTIKK
jgi:hypothetical protein